MIRSFDNPHQLNKSVLLLRLESSDPQIELSVYDQFIPPETYHCVDINSVLSDTVITAALATEQTTTEIAAIVRKVAAKTNAAKVVEIAKLSQNQAATWADRQVHGADTEADLITLINAASSVADLKPVLVKIVHALYQNTKADKAALKLLVALRDEIMPEIGE